MDHWSKYVSNPEPLRAWDVHYDPKSEPEVELIAIHGLGSNPETAWAFQMPTPKPPVLWLRDLLPHEDALKRMKIIQVNHQTRWDANVSDVAFEDHARAVLQVMETVHRDIGRPIIFVAHSFGGLLLEKALLLAKQELSPIATDVRGLLFLGVPHGGTEAAFWASLLSCTAYWRGSSTTLLEYLALGSEEIKRLENEFRNSYVLQKTNRRQILPRIVDFFELRPEKIRSFVLGTTVNSQSAGNRYGEEVMLDTDHRGLNKYGSRKNTNYQKVVEQIKETYEYALQTSTSKANVEPTINVPFSQDKRFVDRDGIAHEICTHILKFDEHKRLAVVGLGGMGKSQIAIQVAYSLQEADRFVWVFWVRCGNTTNFETSYAEIAQTVGIVGPDEVDTRANVSSLVQSWLKNRRNGRWVIILDGIDDLSLFSSKDRRDKSQFFGRLPPVKHGAILITSRQRSIAANLIGTSGESNKIYTIDSMRDENAMELLKSRLPEYLWDENAAAELVQELEGIPLAITQAAACLESMTWEIPDYLHRLRGLRTEYLSRVDIKDARRDEDTSDAILTTWQASFDKILEINSSAIELLCMMSTFDNQRIPRYLISDPMAVVASSHTPDQPDPITLKYEAAQANRSNRPDPPRRIGTTESFEAPRNEQYSAWLNMDTISDWLLKSEKKFEDDIQLLDDFRLITIDKEKSAYSMHLLVQVAVTNWLTANAGHVYTLQDYRDRAIVTLSMAFPYKTYENLRQRSDLFRHAEKVLTYHTKGRIQLLHRAEILYHVAEYLDETENFALALESIKESLKIRSESYLGRNLCVTQTLSLAGHIYLGQQRHEEAEKAYRDALDGFSVSMGFSRGMKEHLQINLGVALANQGKYDEARGYEVAAFDSITTRLGMNDTGTLSSRRVLAQLYASSGDDARAIEHYKEIMSLFAQAPSIDGSDIVEMSYCRLNLSECLTRLGKKEEAERVSRNAVNIDQAQLGEAHNATLKQQYQLAITLWNNGSLDERDKVLQSNVELAYANFGPQNQVYQQTLFKLIEALRERGEPSKVADLLETYPLMLPIDPDYHGEYWKSIGNHAYALNQLDKYEAARPLYEEALPHLERIYGTTSEDDYILYQINYAAVLQNLKLFPESMEVLGKLKRWKDSSTNQAWLDEYESMWKKVTEFREGKDARCSTSFTR
ncbi:hypothetical protein BGZ57DRAFT_929661 [Hyaloscypha finlandica]|nr:hypothetical protein BGZ57DRAFT_929661 [Hyaloscypha finlandica]